MNKLFIIAGIIGLIIGFVDFIHHINDGFDFYPIQMIFFPFGLIMLASGFDNEVKPKINNVESKE